MKRLLKLAALLGLVTVLTTGCAVNRATANVDPSANLSSLKTMYVKRIADDDNTYNLIADKLRSKGVTVSTGTEAAPSGVDAVVTYIDKWMWDMTMYMLELTVNIRDPKTDFPLATGNSFHTSLTRLSPTEMVNEVVDNIYKDAK
ncbi:MAG: hypothetical protein KKE51_11400 [Gammaproteobacteria bacterium]|nr:hypothetical protein [Gammaproteobacteria bacterium]MBU1603650.1 hypothetical protein [Gammaproteobacteria bacterium]MBU2435423.1 hypothetical protein [Gammaproteobacteria bacterium]MBU2449170.1 hypothetical protein [Gammaproteobacteria bacterium]